VIQGEAALKRARPNLAVCLFSEAQKLVDFWLVHFDMSRSYLDAGAFTEADAEFDRCKEIRSRPK
jgi:hypothetical protein